MPSDKQTPFEKIRLNIDALSLAASRLEERRICELHELAWLAADRISELGESGLGFFEALAVISEEISFRAAEPHENALLQSIPWLSAAESSLCELDKAVFSKLLVDRLLTLGHSLTEADFLETEQAEAVFTYVKNQYADEAFDVFSQDFKSPRVKYCNNFKTALKLLEDGEVGYCLLPLEERGTRLSSIASLIYKKDYKISSVTPVFGYDGSADLKYALISRAFSIPEPRAEDDRYMELRIPKATAASPASVLSAAECFGLELYKLNTVYVESEEGSAAQYSLILKVEGRDFVYMLTYLTLFNEEFVPVGIYRNIE